MRNPFPLSIGTVAPGTKPRLLWEKSSSPGVTLDTTFHSDCNFNGESNHHKQANDHGNQTNNNNNNTSSSRTSSSSSSSIVSPSSWKATVMGRASLASNHYHGEEKKEEHSVSKEDSSPLRDSSNQRFFFSRRTDDPAGPTGNTPVSPKWFQRRNNSNGGNNSRSSSSSSNSTAPLLTERDLDEFAALAFSSPSTISFVVRCPPLAVPPTLTSSPSDSASSGNSSIGTGTRELLADLVGIPLGATAETNRCEVVAGHELSSGRTSQFQSQSQSLLPLSLAILLRPGDVLESIDGVPVRLIAFPSGNPTRLGRRFRERRFGKPSAGDPAPLSSSLCFETEEDLCKYLRIRLGSNGNGGEDDRDELRTITLTFACGPQGTEATTTTSNDGEAEATKADAPAGTNARTRARPVHHVYLVNHVPTLPPANDDSKEDDEDNNGNCPEDPFLTLDAVNEAVVVQQTTKEDPTGMPDDASKTTKEDFSEEFQGGANEVQEEEKRDGTEIEAACRSLLRIRSIPRDSWLDRQTHIKAGDVLVSVDDTPCHCNDGDSNMVGIWTDRARHSAVVRIAACSLAFHDDDAGSWGSRLRRAAVTVGGSALMGTGAVLMVTPLHPFGHAMALGGLGVLGTEYEAPKTAIEGVKRSLTRARERRQQQKQGEQRFGKAGTARDGDKRGKGSSEHELVAVGSIDGSLSSGESTTV